MASADVFCSPSYPVARFATQAGGPEFPAQLLGVRRSQAIIAVPFVCEALQPGASIPQLSLGGSGRELYGGAGRVKQAIHTSTGTVCELALEEANWRMAVTTESADTLRTQFHQVLEGMTDNVRLVSGFAAVVTDFQTLFIRLRDWLEAVEAGWESLALPEREQRQAAAVNALSRPVTDALDSIVDRFERLAAEVPAEAVAAHHAHLRERLHPLLLSSPFAWRAYVKPLGYAGDYGMVEMMLRTPAQGASLYAKLVNCWLVSQAPAAAHRHRVAYLRQTLRQEAARVLPLGRPLRVLNLGCGPADEVQQFLEHDPVSEGVEMTLLDFNDETLAYLRGRLDDIRRRTGRGGGVQLVKKSVQQVLKESLRARAGGAGGPYDYVYCAGLFDYLPDEVCRRLLDLFYHWLTPGGLVVATNVSAAMNVRRPFRYSMEYMLDWHLIYRDGGDFARLAPRLPPGQVRVIEEDLGVNLYLEIRKPADA